MITVAMQVRTQESWSDCLAVLHTLKNEEEVSLVAYAISRQNGCVTVRVTYPSFNGMGEIDKSQFSQDYVSRLNGHYYQADR